ncbi:RNA polymerase III RPC4-domain-containing protein [Lipomyces orientalis]|uniref:RNA polymerase III RPC4-domain-containing protein n=1 Tax=Lipomyces orientalis TaxID=1233043 RepID=A0ACC3TPE2_9ASCO
MPPKRVSQSKTPVVSSAPAIPVQASSAFPTPPSRLDSLSRPRAPASVLPPTSSAGLSRAGTPGFAPGPAPSLGGVGGLKFKPKLVARRPKEERDAAAPSPLSAPLASSSTPQSARGRGRGRGRGTTRGGGGAGRRNGVEVASAAAGPFADPSFGDPRASKGPSFEKRPPPSANDQGGQLMLTSTDLGLRGKGSGESDSDDEAIREGVERINIAKVAKIGGAEGSDISRYFPVRDSTDAGVVEADGRGAEDIIDEMAVLAREAEEFVGVFGDDGVDDLERKLYFFQFAPVLPKFESSRAGVKAEQGVKLEQGIKSEPGVTVESSLTSQDGLVGQLYVRKSGRVSIRWGGVEMEVARGADTDFLQDVVVIDDAKERKATLLGQIAKKVVVSPNIDILFGDSEESE